MATGKAITITLSEEEFERLSREAEEAGLRTGTLIGDLVQRHRPSMAQARQLLDDLAQLRADLPEVDVVEVMRRSRDDLEHRG